MIDALPLLLGDDGYQISRSVRLRSSATAYLGRTPASSGSQQRYTISLWAKLGNWTSANDSFLWSSADAGVVASPYLLWKTNAGALTFNASADGTNAIVTAAVFRDHSAWYHIVFAVDTTQATAANRQILYVNGVAQTYSASAYPAQNATLNVNTASHAAKIGALLVSGSHVRFFDGYLTDINFIDGQALTPAAFGETDAITGVWKPRRYTGTYGTNGFFLNFSDPSAATAAAIGADRSGNGNNWTPNNISVTAGATYDSMLDVPTPWADGGNGRGNYAVLNPLNSPSAAQVSNGNLRYTRSGGGSWGSSAATLGVSSGKWYWEYTVGTTSASGTLLGIASTDLSYAGISAYVGQALTSYSYNSANGQKYNNNAAAAYGATFTTNDVIGVALDMDAGTLTFYKNNTSQGTAFSGLSGSFAPAGSTFTTGDFFDANFGQRPFAYTPPTGFRALNTQNLPEPTIKKGNAYFDATLYSGNSGAQNIVNSGAMQPDLVWIKSRSNAFDHRLVDSVRGVGIEIFSNTTAAETTNNANGYVYTFNSNGFGVFGGAGVNGSGSTYVAWQWREGATQGFDIVTYTGTGANRTVAHSLGVAPSMMIVKSRSAGGSSTYDWIVWHSSFPGTDFIRLNSTAARATASVIWNSTVPNSSTFSVGVDSSVNQNTVTYVAYLFSEVAGFSRFGSYTGNGSADGPFVFCGFRPRWVMIKRTDTTTFNWTIKDTARVTANTDTTYIGANDPSAELTNSSYAIDVLSNGFKLRNTDGNWNANGGTYIFAAFAETPQKFSLAR